MKLGSVEPAAAAAVIGFAGFQLLEAWNKNAPSLKEIRAAEPDDSSVLQRLYDADIMVGGVALILGVSFAVLTKDVTALLVMLVLFGSISQWSHAVLRADSR